MRKWNRIIINFKNTNDHILTNQNSDFNNLFIKTINRPESGCDFDCASSDEQPLKAIKMAIQSEHTSNQGFFREDSSFVAIVITDEDELSSGPSSATQPDEIVNLIKQTWGNSKNFTLYGINIKPKDKDCYEANKRTGGNYGNLIQKLANITGGITGSICDEDYGQSLSSIGNRVKNLLSSFTLSEEPLDANKIQVQLTPQQEIKWRLDGKKVIFDKAPKAGTRIDIDYYKKKKEYSAL